MRTRPFSITSVGAIVDAGTRHGPSAFGLDALRAKLSRPLFMNAPAAHVPVPKPRPFVFVTDTALPSASTIERCVVSACAPSSAFPVDAARVAAGDAGPTGVNGAHAADGVAARSAAHGSAAASVGRGAESGEESSETTHLSIVDDQGNAVSVTNTNGLGFGTGTWAAGAFFNSALLNFSRAEGSANALGPWRVPASTIAPTVVLEDGRVREVVGSPGSAAIPPAIVETIVYTLDYGLDPLAALRVPRVIPASNAQLKVEMGFSEPVLAEARRMGFDTQMSPPDMSFGGVHVIQRVGDRWVGAADPRRDGEVRGY